MMSEIKILLVAGTRPNFIKIAPLYHTFIRDPSFNIRLCHTGQHFDRNMSASFWECLELPDPDFDLKISAGNVPDTIGKTIIGINKLLNENTFNLVIVVGDVNATVAGAIAAAQNGIKVMHVESGLRSFDRTMPEEINRVITDHVSDLLMVSETSGLDNLISEGISPDKIHHVGNIMIESLIHTRNHWENLQLPADLGDFIRDPFIAVTFHRPENVDTAVTLSKLIHHLDELSEEYKIIFPVHPRTRHRIGQFDLARQLENENILVMEPLGYFEFLKLVSISEFVITDSGGIQEETTYLDKPCITIRKNTERPVTTEAGTNMLLGLNEDDFNGKIRSHLKKVRNRDKQSVPLWDDQVSTRILHIIKKSF